MKTWMWESFLAAPGITDARLVAACERVLGVRAARINVISDIECVLLDHAHLWDVLIERRAAPGDFPVDVTLYVREDLVSWNADAARDVLVRMCVATGVDCLIEDGWVDPYTMYRVRPSGIVEAVDLNGARLDDDEAYVVQRVRSIVPPPYVAVVGSPAASS